MTVIRSGDGTERAEPDWLAGEKRALDEWVDFHRATLLMKCEGLTSQQLKTRAAEPSRLTLLGLVRHMSEVERGWFRRTAAREGVEFHYPNDEDPEADLNDLDAADAAADIAHFIAECQRCREATADLLLDEVVPSRGHHPERARNIRWIYLHLIEEYTRHNGHADIVRERLDGTTGD
jgi:uncharacterized damage-inducible protein DinB